MKDLLRRLQGTFLVRFGMEYGNSQVASYAAVVAFNGFMTMFPLILGVVTIAGLLFGGAQAAVQQAIVSLFPAPDQVSQALDALHNNAGVFGVIALLGLLWIGTNFFAALEFTLDQVYGERTRGFLHQRVMGVGMLMAFVAAILLAVAVSTLAAYVSFVPFLGFALGAVVMIALLTLIYWVVPNRHQGWRDVWPGAVLCGVLMEVLTLVWPIYTKLMRGFNAYGQTFSLFFLLATWLYFMSQLILIGAVFNRMRLAGGEAVPEAEGVPPRPGTEDAERRRVEVQPARRGRPET